MMKSLLFSCVCLIWPLAFASAFELPSSGSQNTRVEVVDDPSNEREQDILILDRTTGAQIRKISLDCKALEGRLRQAEYCHLTWNPRGTAFVIHGRNGDKEFAAFIELTEGRSYSTHHFADSHSEGCTMVNFAWTSDTVLQASFLLKDKRAVIEDWTIDGSFKCVRRPTIRPGGPRNPNNPDAPADPLILPPKKFRGLPPGDLNPPYAPAPAPAPKNSPNPSPKR